jgi:hypothetical protein
VGIREEALQRIEAQRGFRPTAEVHSPSVRTKRLRDDVAAVVAGSKPAAIVSQLTIDRELWGPHILLLAQQRGLTVKPLADLFGRNDRLVVVGLRANVEEIEKLTAAGRRTPATADYHRRLGKALGYSKEAIEKFVGPRRSFPDKMAEREDWY